MTASPSITRLPIERRSTDAEIARAIDLGWRVSALFALSPTQIEGVPLDARSLPSRATLSGRDRIDLELQTMIGLAEQLGAPLADTNARELVAKADVATDSAAAEDDFRLALAHVHIALIKRLSARDRAFSHAYELGTLIAETYHRVLRCPEPEHLADELRYVFASERTEEVTRLLNDLQGRIDPVAARIVRIQLRSWSQRLQEVGLSRSGAVIARVPDVLDRQVSAWRRMLTGDMEPEAFLGVRHTTLKLRAAMRRQVMRRYITTVGLAGILLLVALGLGVALLFANDREVIAALVGTAVTAVTARGVARELPTVKLLWESALVEVVAGATLHVDEVLPPPLTRRRMSRF